MGRPGKQIVASAEQRLLLERLLKNRTQPAALYLRIQLVLQCMEGKSLGEIAAQNKVTSKTVSWWRDRYIAHGLDGLRDKPRSGRPRQYTAAFQETILGKLEEQPPVGHAVWTGSLLAQATGYSKHAIWRFLRDQRIALARRRSWCISTAPEFAAKAADVVGLYLAPPENALVLCVDEKPKIQALERRCGYAVSSDGRLVQGLESTYKRQASWHAEFVCGAGGGSWSDSCADDAFVGEEQGRFFVLFGECSCRFSRVRHDGISSDYG